MKTIDKIRFPEVHINPINRDLFLTMVLGFLTALAMGTIVAMMVSRL